MKIAMKNQPELFTVNGKFCKSWTEKEKKPSLNQTIDNKCAIINRFAQTTQLLRLISVNNRKQNTCFLFLYTPLGVSILQSPGKAALPEQPGKTVHAYPHPCSIVYNLG